MEGGDRVWVAGWGLLEFSVRKSDAMSDMCIDLGVQMSDFCDVLVWVSGRHFRREIWFFQQSDDPLLGRKANIQGFA